MMRICILLTGIVFFVSCGGKEEIPPGILKPKKMQAVLWDVIKAESFTSEFLKKDSVKTDSVENYKLQQQLFAIHKVTRDEFYKSYDYYRSNTTLFKQVLDSMIAQEQQKKDKNFKPYQAQ